MSQQLLINVISATVPAGAVAYAVAHGLRSNDLPVEPTLVMPAAQSEVTVASFDETNLYLANPTGAPISVSFRVERGLSVEVDAAALTPFVMSTGTGGVTGVSVAAPINDTGTPTAPIIGLDTGGISTTYLADGAVTPAKTTPLLQVANFNYSGALAVSPTTIGTVGPVATEAGAIVFGTQPAAGFQSTLRIVNTGGTTAAVHFRLTMTGGVSTLAETVYSLAVGQSMDVPQLSYRAIGAADAGTTCALSAFATAGSVTLIASSFSVYIAQ